MIMQDDLDNKRWLLVDFSSLAWPRQCSAWSCNSIFMRLLCFITLACSRNSITWSCGSFINQYQARVLTMAWKCSSLHAHTLDLETFAWSCSLLTCSCTCFYVNQRRHPCLAKREWSTELFGQLSTTITFCLIFRQITTLINLDSDDKAEILSLPNFSVNNYIQPLSTIQWLYY